MDKTCYLVTGASSGLGQEIALALSDMGHRVFNLDIHDPKNHVQYLHCDVTSRDSIACVKNYLSDRELTVFGIVNCAGINHQSWFEDLKESDFDRLMSLNCKAHWIMTQEFLEDLKETHGIVCNVVSNAAHMPMTASLSYNVSKAAAKMVTQQMAHELTKKYGITIFSVSPNKMFGTGMSKYIDETVPGIRGWTPEYATEYQLKGLLTGKESDPEILGRLVAHIIKDKSSCEYFSGCDIPLGK